MGLRFRLHRRDLPGTPDLVFPKRRTVLFVHGCFWHRHPGCGKAGLPKSRVEFWRAKFDRNVERDRRVAEVLAAAGWTVAIVWECETKKPAHLARAIERIFGLGRGHAAKDRRRAPARRPGCVFNRVDGRHGGPG